MTKVQTSMTCFSCIHWSATYTHCMFGLTEHRYQDKHFCRRWQEGVKYSIAKEAIQTQVNISRWNGPNITHRRLEPL